MIAVGVVGVRGGGGGVLMIIIVVVVVVVVVQVVVVVKVVVVVQVVAVIVVIVCCGGGGCCCRCQVWPDVDESRYILASSNNVYPADEVYLPHYEKLAMGQVPARVSFTTVAPRLRANATLQRCNCSNTSSSRTPVVYIGRAAGALTEELLWWF